MYLYLFFEDRRMRAPTTQKRTEGEYHNILPDIVW